MTAITPPFTYYGGKTAIAQRIVDLLPPHLHYVEPFAGSLAVLLAKPRSRMETVNDINGDLMLFWRVIRDQPDELRRVMDLTPHSRGEHAAAFDRDGAVSDLERARRVWVKLTQGRTGRLNPTGWKYRIDGAAVPETEALAAFTRRVPARAQRLAGVSLEQRNALEIIDRYGQSPTVLIYADPPYLASARNGTNYQHELSTETQHKELAGALCQSKATVVLSGYHSPLYDELYAGWHVTEIAASTSNSAPGEHARIEVLWSNRPLGQPDLFGQP